MIENDSFKTFVFQLSLSFISTCKVNLLRHILGEITGTERKMTPVRDVADWVVYFHPFADASVEAGV